MEYTEIFMLILFSTFLITFFLIADAQLSIMTKPSIMFTINCNIHGGYVTTFNVTNTGVCITK